jgi:hypothetical protein
VIILGGGIVPYQGFPGCALVATCRVTAAASPLFKPDMQISRIRLSRKSLLEACTT